MSRVMNALKSSEQGYQTNAMAVGYRPAAYATEKKKNFRWYHGAMAIIPSAITLAVLSYQSYQFQQENIRKVLSQPVQVEQVSAPVDYLPYPLFSDLKNTYVVSYDTNESLDTVRELPLSDNTTVVNISEPQPINQKENESSSLDLEQLDLRGLSPALVMRVESALKSRESSSTSGNSSAIALVQNAEKYSGILPAMDFQTHVYASSVGKRWIKMNGVEYHEGDELSDGVKLVQINPQTTLIQFEQQLIEIPALYHWQG
ncbi:general secretion pathway protein GspB [Vibrio ziniensis]|uniref:General secretion pathway protein GspB n=1 Tax=Vibrio ziniensis TaxID=2711221 RepID=A0A6G7CFN1_9VIBR|nr:general secretion pathway protein GspB [Vibrio ziniensis]QIH40873.1 general secretion pathway protein GspB [Vibrio ziniensis]